MDNEDFKSLEDLLVEARNRTRVVFDEYKPEQAGHQYAYYLYSDVCKALAYLRALNDMNV